MGAGVVGASIAQRLARAGQRVVVLERGSDIGAGCSYANAAIVSPDHVAPLATPAMLRETPGHMVRRPPTVRVRPDLRLIGWLAALVASATPGRVRRTTQRLRALAERSAQLHRELHEQGISPGLRKTGAVDVRLSAPARPTSDWLTPEELRAVEPACGGAVAGGEHQEHEWTLESRQYTRAMLDDAVAHGAELVFGTEMAGFVQTDGRVRGVHTDTGTVDADAVILAAGLGVTSLAAQVGVRIPVRGGRGYVIDLAPGPDDPVMPIRLKDRRIVVTPLPDRVRISGAMEFGQEGRPPRPGHAARLRDVAASVIPTLADRPVLEEWVGERPCVPDGVPTIGASDLAPGLHVAAGHGMWGMILAPVTAELVAESVAASAQGLRVPADRDWLHPDRFTRGR